MAISTRFNGRGTRRPLVLRPNYAQPHDCPECARWLTLADPYDEPYQFPTCFYATEHRNGREVMVSRVTLARRSRPSSATGELGSPPVPPSVPAPPAEAAGTDDA